MGGRRVPPPRGQSAQLEQRGGDARAVLQLSRDGQALFVQPLTELSTVLKQRQLSRARQCPDAREGGCRPPKDRPSVLTTTHFVGTRPRFAGYPVKTGLTRA